MEIMTGQIIQTSVSILEKFGKNAFYAKLRKNIYRNTGGTMVAQTARNMILGLDILELRVERCYQNCISLGAFLQGHSKVKNVDYPGLKNDSGFEKANKYFSGIPGTVMSLDLESKEACYEFMNRLKFIRQGNQFKR